MGASAKRVARLAALTAAGAVLLALANALPSGRLAVLAAASFPVCMAMMLYGPGWSAGVFAVTAALGLALYPAAASIGYAAFFGWYPIAKSLCERLKSRTAGWALKYALYGAAFAAWWFLARALFAGLDAALPWYALAALGVAVFWIYDKAYSLMIGFYLDKIARFFK